MQSNPYAGTVAVKLTLSSAGMQVMHLTRSSCTAYRAVQAPPGASLGMADLDSAQSETVGCQLDDRPAALVQ